MKPTKQEIERKIDRLWEHVLENEDEIRHLKDEIEKLEDELEKAEE